MEIPATTPSLPAHPSEAGKPEANRILPKSSRAPDRSEVASLVDALIALVLEGNRLAKH